MRRLHLIPQFAAIVLFAACTKDLYVPPTEDGKIGEVTLDDYYDYATSKFVQLNIDYGRDCAKAYFEVYAENPFEVKDCQIVMRKDLLPVASGFTNEKGVYDKKASITSSVTKAYIYSPDFGVPTLYATEVVNDQINAKITFDNVVNLPSMLTLQSSSVRTTSTINSNFSNKLGEWDSNGKPKYLDLNAQITVTDELKYYITTYFPESKKNNNSTFVTDDADLDVQKKANVWINYFGGTTGAQSTFAYYCYDKNATIDQVKAAASKACVVFPSVYKDALGDYSGVAVKLQYIDQSGKLAGDVFPEGTKIGFLIWNNGWTNGNNGSFGNNVFYSTASLNSDKKSHTAVFAAEDQGKKYNVITMEDWNDFDYNDVAFVIQSNPVEAIVVPPAAKPGDRKGTDIYRGLLCYEDNWPNKGDYDMNDVIMKYQSSVDYNYDNNILGMTDKFTLVWTGANYNNGFAYELPFDLSQTTVEVLGTKNYSVKGNVITLFNNAKSELGVSNVDAKDMPNQNVKEVPYTVSIKFKSPNISKDKVVPPYNPFVRKNNTEIHLTNYKPTPYADNVFDQSNADISDGVETFFVCKDGFPFAIHLDARTDASILNISLKAEGEENRIDKRYPLFVEWAKTKDPLIQWWKK